MLSLLIEEGMLEKCFRRCSSCDGLSISPLAPQYVSHRVPRFILDGDRGRTAGYYRLFMIYRLVTHNYALYSLHYNRSLLQCQYVSAIYELKPCVPILQKERIPMQFGYNTVTSHTEQNTQHRIPEPNKEVQITQKVLQFNIH